MTATSGSLLSSYQPPTSTWDEMVDADGTVRDYWTYLAGAIDTLGLDELRQRQHEIDRLLRDDGVTQGNHGDPQGNDIAWLLDPVPLLIASDNWGRIERGVQQRAELLSSILSDVYGPRRLIAGGLLPPEVIFGHTGYLRACDGIRLPGKTQLPLYGADLARDASGEVQVLSDLTQAPSGMGYALENRSVMSRVFPSIYRDAQVHGLDGFFRALRVSLAEAAPADVDDPTIVLLTPGRFNRSYFEHAFLATSLGYPLVEAADLTVADGQVWLRALGGMKPVHVIIRRVDGWFCDPLELRADSQLGVPGLLETARRGNVSLVNPVGASVVENAALARFLPTLSESLLGEELLLPSVSSWWCGDDAERSHVLANLDTLAIRPIARSANANVFFGWEASAAQLDELRARILAEPNRWVGQQRVAASGTPTLQPSGLRAHPSVLRTFAVGREGSWMVMPGGLASTTAQGADEPASTRTSRFSKDTWVLASEPEKTAGTLLSDQPTLLPLDPGGSIPSRAAENLFWMGRYAERAESTVRLLRVIFDRRTEFAGRPHAAGAEALAALMRALADVSGVSEPGLHDPDEIWTAAGVSEALRAVLLDSDQPGSLAANLRSLLDATNAVRDQLSGDTWLAMANVERDLQLLASPVDPDAAAQVAIGRILKSLLAVSGLAAESMVRDPGWHFLDAGRRLERSLSLARLLRSTVVTPMAAATQGLVVESVLIASESIITYRRRYHSHSRTDTLLDLLLADASNPRSLAYQLDQLTTDVDGMPRARRNRLEADQRLVLECSTRLRLSDTSSLVIFDDTGVRSELSDFLSWYIDQLQATAAAIDRLHFVHLQRGHMLVAEPHAVSDLMESIIL